MTNYVVEGTIGGDSVQVSYTHNIAESGILGCHSTCISGLGLFVFNAIRHTNGTPIYGDWRAANTLGSGIENPYRVPTKYPLLDIRNLVYSDIIKRKSCYGCVVFSDRVNRGAGWSGEKWKFGNTPRSCAALAKWLVGHPELGRVYASAVFNNPNYKEPSHYGLCQTFVFIPERVNSFVESGWLNTGPNRATFNKNILNNVGAGFVGYDRTTYDE